MKGGKPPEEYKLFVVPNYLLVHSETNRVDLPNKLGEILSIVIGARGFPVSSAELAKTLYANEGGGIERWRKPTVHVHINHLKRRLKAHGIEILLRCTEGKLGYRFLGFRECEKVPEDRPKKNTPKGRRYDPSRCNAADKTNPVMKINKRFPQREITNYESVKDAPWSFPVRHSNHESKRWDWSWSDYVEGQNPKRD
jgi:DNA-binding winged helix-turn-helix (wHTH) protein